MRIIDITLVMNDAIEETIFEKWKHEGNIELLHTNEVFATIDGKLYKISIQEVSESTMGEL